MPHGLTLLTGWAASLRSVVRGEMRGSFRFAQDDNQKTGSLRMTTKNLPECYAILLQRTRDSRLLHSR